VPTKSPHTTWSKLRESPRDWRTVRWLRKKPVPAYVIGIDDEGEEIRVELVGKVGERPHWADAARALHQCEKLTAHNAGGGILRVMEHDDEHDPELRAEAQREESRATSSAPVGSPLLAIDVPRLVKEIADSMKDVANSTAEHQANAHAEAFKQMGNVLTIALNLLARLDAELDARTPAPAAEASQDDLAGQVMKALAARGNGNGGAAPGLDLAGILQSVSPDDVREFLALLKTNTDGGPGDGGH
jgi:hypothetical protein